LNDGEEENKLITDIIENKAAIGKNLISKLNDWIGESLTNEIFLIFPSDKFGCRTIQVVYNDESEPENDKFDKTNTLTIHCLDSVYKNNETFNMNYFAHCRSLSNLKNR
jgi:hypothetical protein